MHRREVSGLGTSSDLCVAFFPLRPYFLTSPGGWMWEPQNCFTLEKLVSSHSGRSNQTPRQPSLHSDPPHSFPQAHIHIIKKVIHKFIFKVY